MHVVVCVLVFEVRGVIVCMRTCLGARPHVCMLYCGLTMINMQLVVDLRYCEANIKYIQFVSVTTDTLNCHSTNKQLMVLFQYQDDFGEF